MSVVIETTIGDITVDLYLKERPNTCLNFLKLCKIKYYNLCLFYKIEKNFIAQSGDPTATGRGGESVFCHLYGEQAKYFDVEFKPPLKHIKLGTLSMVNNGSNMNGSQFFLTLSDNLTYLDENHTVFGEVAEGFDVLLKLNDAICDNNNRPYQDIRITHTVILHDPFEDPKGLQIPDASPEPTKEMLESNYIGADEEIDDNKGKNTEEIEEKIKESEAKARATILEMVGDIPDADVKPPENVLFVCKLNPVTTSEDLEIIFSRFGKILSCEVIKDKKTGDSLQYAFIEFEKEEDCEAAYFKMDNVLIDDRRIHVDFSQSVSKMNFGKDKFQISKPTKSSISLKNTERPDGYDLIFDMGEDDRSRKQKSREIASKYEPSSKEKKRHSRSKEKECKGKSEHLSHEKKYKYAEGYKYNYEKDKINKNREHHYSNFSDRNRNIDEYSKSKNRYTSQDNYRDSKSFRYSRSRRNSDYHRKTSETYSNEHRSSQNKGRHDDSMSPDRLRKSHDRYKEHSPYNSHSSRAKNSENANYHKYSRKTKKSKSCEKNRRETSLQKLKDNPKKAYSSEKQKKSRSSSSSSSSSDSDSSSSSSSSASSSDYKHKVKLHHQKREFSNLKDVTLKSLKKRKRST